MLVITVTLHKQSTEDLCKYRSIKIRKQSIERSMLEETTGHDDDLHNAESNIVVVFRTKNWLPQA